jgi:branched-subunit amino acid aminotransferase/4-amino-4-deoxychorismate lyase
LILAKIELNRADSHEGVILNWEGLIVEGTISNIFHVKSGIVYSPHLKTSSLEGVTSGQVLDLARMLQMPMSETAVRPQDLMGTDECFITNTTSEIIPVVMVDKNPIRNGKPSRITMTLHQAYKEEVPLCLMMQSS